jgi:hypothetical protein
MCSGLRRPDWWMRWRLEKVLLLSYDFTLSGLTPLSLPPLDRSIKVVRSGCAQVWQF